MQLIKTHSYLQVDDYLDLLNYAKQLNDTEWQQELKEALQHQLLENGKETKDSEINALWQHFDQINDRLLELFDLLRNSNNTVERNSWSEQIWELKLERIKLEKQIQASYAHY
ncbi:hypothetical protein ASL14_00320 [Paenibacillus sp. IHB B 3084]|uniref:hypothetical protein n=1 Tax=Paenibacillus TaxID=44249 RepID=UPI00071FF24A|nr:MULTISPECIES: hypothetical protein [Paenibacillus]ALP34845.1 hypothetical protein ASL14_00320 [Paenibacillus sp. IHB B 3084]MBE0338309.1 hypothetical protein [Paenibacillus sp. 23TSA30-6]